MTTTAKFIDLINMVVDRINAEDRPKLGAHMCPGGDHDGTHSADVDHGGLLSRLFHLHAGDFYL